MVDFAADFAALASAPRLLAVLGLLDGPVRRRDLIARTGLDEAAFGRAETELAARGLLLACGETVVLQSSFSSRCRRYLEVALPALGAASTRPPPPLAGVRDGGD